MALEWSASEVPVLARTLGDESTPN